MKEIPKDEVLELIRQNGIIRVMNECDKIRFDRMARGEYHIRLYKKKKERE